MQLIELGDANSFLSRSNSLLMRAEAENQLLLSSALALARASAGRSPRLSFFVVENQNTIEAAALNVTRRRFLLSTSSPEAAFFMGKEFATRTPELSCLMGPSESVLAFAEGFAQGGGTPFSISQTHLTLKLTQLAPITPASGMWRAAKEKDLKLLREWSFDFVTECNLDEPPEETEEVVRRYIESRQLFIWEDPMPVAMAGFGGITPGGVRVNMVYTRPNARARGYAASLVAAISHKLLASGAHKNCFIIVNAENAPALKIYERLGYRRVSESLEMRRQPDSVSV